MEELLGRKVPQSLEAEQAVLGSMIIDPACIPVVLERLKGREFYSQTNSDIFQTLTYMFNYAKTIDPVTLLDEMRLRGVYQDNSRDYVLRLMEITPTAANVGKYAEIVRDKALLRSLLQTSDEIGNMVYEGEGEADTLLEAAEQKIFALRRGRSVGGLQEISVAVQNVYSAIAAAAVSKDTIPGLPTGLVDLDRQILGLNRGDLVLIASRPGMGKTSIALNIAMAVAQSPVKRHGEEVPGKKNRVAIFSLEMAREQLAMRLISSEVMIDNQKLQTGKLSPSEFSRVGGACAAISSSGLLIDDNPMLTVAEMNAQCRRVEDLALVVVDYLQLMQSSGSGKNYSNESRTQAVSDISRMMKIMAKDLNVPVVCLSQLSRANEARADKRPLLSDLRESGAIEQDADIVIGLYREGYYNRECENPNAAEAIILKNRRGETGKVDLMWLPEYTSYRSVERRHED